MPQETLTGGILEKGRAYIITMVNIDKLVQIAFT